MSENTKIKVGDIVRYTGGTRMHFTENATGEVVFIEEDGDWLLIEMENGQHSIFVDDLVPVDAPALDSRAERIKRLEAERDAANAAMLIYREFYEVARDADKVSELTDSTNYDHDTLNLWVDAVEAVKKIRALEGKSE